MAEEETTRTGAQSSAPSLLDADVLERPPDSIMRHPVEFYQQLLDRQQSTLRSLVASHKDLERYVNRLHGMLPSVDLQALQFAAFGIEAGSLPRPSEGAIKLAATDAVNKKTSSTAKSYQQVWSSLPTPTERPHRPEAGCENDTQCFGCKSSTGEGMSHERHFTHRDLCIDDGKIILQADDKGAKFGNTISSPTLVYRLHRLSFRSTHLNPAIVTLKHRDTSLAEIRFAQWSRPEIEFLGTPAAASDLCELLTFLCGPSWYDYAGTYDLNNSILKLHQEFPDPC